MEDENKELEMEVGDRDETVYDSEGREKLVEDGEISPEEEGFMEGAEDDGEQGKCAHCGGAILEDALELDLDGKVYWCCSAHCAEKFKEKKLGEEQA